MKRYQVWLYKIMAVVLGTIVSSAALAADEPVGRMRVEEVQEQGAPRKSTPVSRTTSRTVVIPEFSVTFSGNDYAVDRFQKYARSIGQDVRFRSSSYEVVWEECQPRDGSRWLDLAQQLGQNLSGQIDIQDFQKIAMRATIFRRGENGDENVWTVSKTASAPNIRFSGSYWSEATSLNAGQEIDPYEKLRRKAVDAIIPELMVELQRTVVADKVAEEREAEAERQAACETEYVPVPRPAKVQRVSKPRRAAPKRVVAKSGFSYTFVLDADHRRSLTFKKPLRANQTLKIMKSGCRIGEVTVGYFDSSGREVYVVGSDDMKIASPGTTIVPG